MPYHSVHLSAGSKLGPGNRIAAGRTLYRGMMEVRAVFYSIIWTERSCNKILRPNPISHFYPQLLTPWLLALGTESQELVVEIYLHEMGHPLHEQVISSLYFSGHVVFSPEIQHADLSCSYVACVSYRHPFVLYHSATFSCGRH